MLKTFTIKTLLIGLLTLIAVSSFSQRLTHVQGEILIKLKENTAARNWVKKKQQLRVGGEAFRYHQKVSEPMRIHSIKFDHTLVNENELLAKLRHDPEVAVAQFNHLLSLRSTVPNDQGFGNQWQYINTGQSGGTSGVDIDMDLAWDTTTGGLTADGDTIVVCVIDDGIDATHPDMAPNIWVNHAEIPGNGQDDDGNGYVDDYRGWDTGSQSDEVYDGGWHGTPVAGIIGAKGNNNIGVAGVNWDVKLMIVQGGSGQESEVLQAYSYPLTMRKRYNASNGAEGAFVVATNASWGVNQGQPADAPLWCAFYDTLGVHGILNAGATANAAFDIDVVGDLPTACSSDYLIAVTNIDHNDVKITGAGWGLTTIDLGAFGEDTWTVTIGGGYGGFGGTSGATPHVAGTIGLLYSAPCPEIISLAKSNPGEAALLMKEVILNGVDANASLDGITVTGGRLNVNKSMELLLTRCGPCPAPFAVSASLVTDASAQLNWETSDSTQTTDLRWRSVGNMNWNEVRGASAPYDLAGLMACTEYEFSIKGFCNSDTSDFSRAIVFKTDGCCENPADFMLTSFTDSSAAFSWGSVLAAQSYNLRIREIGAANWQEVNTTELTYEFLDLNNCTEYETQIQLVCAAESIDYSASISFKTKGCGACLDLVYCEAPDIGAGYEWIEQVMLNTLNNTSGVNQGYGDFTASAFTTDLATFGMYDLSLSPGFDAGGSFLEYFKVWIDFNQDGDFNDINEEVFDAGGSSSTAVTGTVSIPGDAVLGLTRMRVGMNFENAPSACQANSGFGEYEDYCVTIVQGVECGLVTMLDTMNVEAMSAELSWTAVGIATGYEVRHKKQSETNWITTNSATNMIMLDNLEECSDYEAQVKTLCDGGESAFSASKNFSTDCMTSAQELIKELDEWRVFPVPFKEEVRLQFSFSQRQDYVRIELINQLGQRVYQEEQKGLSAGEQQMRINTQDLSAGIYFVRMSTASGEAFSQKVVKGN